MLLKEIFVPSRIKIGLESDDKEELFDELVDVLARDGGRSFPRTAVLAAIRDRESKMSTGIKRGIALPHGKVEGLDGITGAFGLSRRGISYDSLDGQPVYLVFLLLSSTKESELHLAALKRLARLLDDPDFYAEIIRAETPERAHALIASFEERFGNGGAAPA